MYCVKCGSLINEGERFCKICGKPVTVDSQIAMPMNTQSQSNFSPKKKSSVGLIILISILGGMILCSIAAILGFYIIRDDGTNSVKVDTVAEVQNEEAQREETEEVEEVPPTASQGMPQSEEEFKAACKYYTYEELARNPKNYQGEPVILYGQVIQVIEEGDNVQLRVNITEGEYNWQDAVYVTYTRNNANESRILEGDLITLWGVSEQTISYETVLGNTLTVPYIEAAYIEQGMSNQIFESNSYIGNGVYNQGNNTGDYVSYILPYSDIYYLSDEDVRYLSKEDLRLARNEIYARHGRMFNSQELQDYFNSQSWYTPSVSADDFNESMLSEVEKYNANLIKEYEDQFN